MDMDIVHRKVLGENLHRVTIAANEKVRQPPELDFGGLSTENYARNPVVMWAHDAIGRSPSGGLPIARTLNLTRSSEGEMVADFEFLTDDPFVQRIENAWHKGFLQAASISWIPLETVPVEGGGWRDTRSDLLEWSIVSLPADPDALRESHRRMMDAFFQEPASKNGPSTDGAGVHEPMSWNPKPQANAPQGQGMLSRISPENSLPLSSDDYDGLTTALALLRDVVGGRQQSGRTRGSANRIGDTADQVAESEVTAIRAMVASVKNTLLYSHSDSVPNRTN